MVLHQLLLQSKDILSDFFDDPFELLVALAGGVIQPPVVVEWSADERTADVAAHRDGNIRRRNGRDQLGILRLFHVDTVQLFHQAHSILIDLRLGFRSSRIALEYIRGKCLAKCLGDLARQELWTQIKATFFIGISFTVSADDFPLHRPNATW